MCIRDRSETQSQDQQNYSSQLENQLREMNRLIRGRLKIEVIKRKLGMTFAAIVWVSKKEIRFGCSTQSAVVVAHLSFLSLIHI